MSELPKGWTAVELNDVLDEIRGGGTPSKSNANYFDGNIPLMTVKDMKVSRPSKAGFNITKEALENSSAKMVPANTVVIATRMGLGKVIRPTVATAINQDLKALFPSLALNSDFLEQWLLSNTALLESMGAGTTVKGIRLEQLREMKFDLPPLAEQKRIVEKLDSLTTSSREAAAALSNVEALIERYRAAVLSQFFGQADCQRGTVADFAEIQLGKMLDKRKNKGVLKPYLRNISVRWGSFDLTDLKEMKFEDRETKKFGIMNGDLMVCEGGEPGRCAVWRNGPTKIMFQKALMRLRCKGENVPEYLYYQLAQLAQVGNLEEHFTGTTIKHLPQRALSNVPISIHTPKKQIEIVAKIDAAFSQIDTITSAVMAARARLETLDRAILDRAFKGKLVPQDPNDEPATVLLERIQTEKEANSKTKPKHKPSKTPSAKKKRSTMTKSRFDDDVKGKPYLARILGKNNGPLTAQQIYSSSDLSIADFYKQLAEEVANGFIIDRENKLEGGNAA